MNHSQIHAALRRLKIRLVKRGQDTGKQALTSDKANYQIPKNVLKKSRKIAEIRPKNSIRFDILRKLKAEFTNDSNNLPEIHNLDKDFTNGTTVADYSQVPCSKVRQPGAPIDSKAPAPIVGVPQTTADGVPTKQQLEIFELRRAVAYLECAVRDRDEKIIEAIGALEGEMQRWRTYLYDHVDDTPGGILRRVQKLKSALESIKRDSSRIYPSFKTPKRWEKKN